MIRHDQMRTGGESEIDGSMPRAQHVHLLEQHGGVHHASVADHGRHVRVDHAGRDETQRKRLITDDDGVTGVVATLISNDDVRILGKQVCNLAFALITPLRADHDRCGHSLEDRGRGGAGFAGNGNWYDEAMGNRGQWAMGNEAMGNEQWAITGLSLISGVSHLLRHEVM